MRITARSGLLVAAVVLAVILGGCTSTHTPASVPHPSSSSSSASSPAGSSSAGSSAPVGTSVHSLTVDGLRRSFRLHLPASLPHSAALVVMLHGGDGSAAVAEAREGWDGEADSQHFVVAYPQGIDAGWSVGGGCCQGSRNTTAHDVDFISAMVRAISGMTTIDPTRVYATGISEGGMMAYRLACDTSLFAAIGPDSATLLGSCPSPHPLSVIHIHGTADTRIPYDGSAGSGVHHINGPPIPALSAFWRNVDDCGQPTTRSSAPVTTATASCPDGRSVELITIAGAGHQWPGSRCSRRCRAGDADPPSTALNATATIWRFFAAHPA